MIYYNVHILTGKLILLLYIAEAFMDLHVYVILMHICYSRGTKKTFIFKTFH
jgi:hypothetical protein